MVKYIADSACDLKDFPDICFETVPLTLSTDSRTIVDSPDLDIHETLDYFYGHHGRSYTACPSTQAWIDSFEGADEIYVVTITSGLSGRNGGRPVSGISPARTVRGKLIRTGTGRKSCSGLKLCG